MKIIFSWNNSKIISITCWLQIFFRSTRLRNLEDDQSKKHLLHRKNCEHTAYERVVVFFLEGKYHLVSVLIIHLCACTIPYPTNFKELLSTEYLTAFPWSTFHFFIYSGPLKTLIFIFRIFWWMFKRLFGFIDFISNVIIAVKILLKIFWIVIIKKLDITFIFVLNFFFLIILYNNFLGYPVLKTFFYFKFFKIK